MKNLMKFNVAILMSMMFVANLTSCGSSGNSTEEIIKEFTPQIEDEINYNDASNVACKADLSSDEVTLASEIVGDRTIVEQQIIDKFLAIDEFINNRTEVYATANQAPDYEEGEYISNLDVLHNLGKYPETGEDIDADYVQKVITNYRTTSPLLSKKVMISESDKEIKFSIKSADTEIEYYVTLTYVKESDGWTYIVEPTTPSIDNFYNK